MLKVQRQSLDHAENTLNEDANQGVDEGLLKQEQIHIEVREEINEIPVIDKTRVDNAQSSQEGFEENLEHQGKTLSTLGEIGVGWRPKTRPKNKMRLNMKKLVNPKLA